MSNQQNLVITVIVVAFLSILGFLVWSGGVVIPGSDSPQAVAGSEKVQEPLDLAVEPESLGGEKLVAQGESGGRSKVETPEFAPDPNTILLTGRLVDEGKRPIANLAVNFRPNMQFNFTDLEDLRRLSRDEDEMKKAQAERTVETVTAADGAFAIRVKKDAKGLLLLPEETDSLFVKSSGSTLPVASYTKDVDLGDLSLIPGATISGKVVDHLGQPVAGVSVSVGSASGFRGMMGRGGEKTDSEGKFSFRSLRPGKHQLSTTASGFIPASQSIEIAKGERLSDIVLRLEQGAIISGTVLDDQGRPIVGAKVASYRKRELGGNFEITQFDDREAVETDRNGYFALSGIDAESVVLKAFAEGHGDEQIDDVLLGASNVSFHLPRHGSISGLLVNAQGDPIAGSKVWVKRDRGLGGFSLFESFGKTESAEDGSFTIEGVPAGDLLVTADGDMHQPVDPIPVRLQPGGEVGDVRLIAETGAIIDVLVLDDQGDPVEGAEVKVSPFKDGQQELGGGRFVTRSFTASSGHSEHDDIILGGGVGGALGRGTTDAEGRVRIAGLPVAAVSLTAEHESMISPAGGRIELDANQIIEQRLIMKPGGFIQLATLDSNGQPRPETPYEVEGPQIAGQKGAKKSGTTNGEGFATIGPLPAGDYSAIISLDSGTHFSPSGGMEIVIDSGASNTLGDSKRSVIVRPGETSEVSLVRPILTHFSGILSDASGPVSSAQVSLRKGKGGGPGLGRLGRGGLSATTDQDGRFSIEDIQAGTYKLEYGRENALIKHEEELIVPPAQAELSRNLMLQGGSVRISVLDDQDGMPVERAKVSIRKPGSASDSGGGRSMNLMMISSSSDSGGPSSTSIRMGGGASTVMTDENGVAVLEDLPPGDYTIEVKHQRFADQTVEDVKVVDGRVTESGQVQMSPAGFIRGTVTGFGEAGGMRMALIELKQVGSDEEPKKQPAMNGSFNFDGLKPGLYEVKARRLGLGSGANSDEWGITQTVEVVAGKRARPQVPLPEGR